MSTLRKLRVNSIVLFFVVAGTIMLIVVDSKQNYYDSAFYPDNADYDLATDKIYIAGVRLYQQVSHNFTFSRFVQCRYYPSCSKYSIEAVERHGIGKGLVLTLKRILSCWGNVPMGTSDPVPTEL